MLESIEVLNFREEAVVEAIVGCAVHCWKVTAVATTCRYLLVGLWLASLVRCVGSAGC